MITQLYVSAAKRRAEMEADVFAHPPKDWSEYQKRLGSWIELNMQVEELERLIKGEEDDT